MCIPFACPCFDLERFGVNELRLSIKGYDLWLGQDKGLDCYGQSTSERSTNPVDGVVGRTLISV